MILIGQQAQKAGGHCFMLFKWPNVTENKFIIYQPSKLNLKNWQIQIFTSTLFNAVINYVQKKIMLKNNVLNIRYRDALDSDWPDIRLTILPDILPLYNIKY